MKQQIFPHSQPPGPSSWLCLSATVPEEAVEGVANFLVELGALGIVEGIRDLSQPVSALTEVQGYFPGEASGPSLRDALSRYVDELTILFPDLGTMPVQCVAVTNEAWHERWRDHFPPIAVGERFLLLPPWAEVPHDTNRLVIVIDPNMAFGTGHHATTQGCLEAIESLCDHYGVPDRALDIGTGSGILAIALALLGTQVVWATDIDSVALDEAWKNSEKNKVVLCIHLSDLPIERLPVPFPLVVANLFAHTLVTLASTLTTAVEQQGHLILSGIQTDQEAEVQAAYASPHWRLTTRLLRDEWATLVFRRA